MWTWSAKCGAAFPDILLMADANSAYTLADAARLKCLDEFDLMMIEQPLAHDEIIDHAKLQAQLEDADLPGRMHPLGAPGRSRRSTMDAGRIINIKLGRVGGFAEAKTRARCRAGGGRSGVVRRNAGSGHRARAQHRAVDAAEFHAAGRRLGEQALLGARHHHAGGGNDAARDHRGARRAGIRIRSRSRFPATPSRSAGKRPCPISSSC